MNKLSHELEMIKASQKIETDYNKKALEDKDKTLTPKQLAVYTLIKNNPNITFKAILVFFNITRSTLKEHIEALLIKKTIKSKVVGRNGAKVYTVDGRRKL
jgi:DNA-binding MarR family transcriptional regulator